MPAWPASGGAADIFCNAKLHALGSEVSAGSTGARMVLADAILGASGTICPATWQMPGCSCCLGFESRVLLADLLCYSC